MYKIVKNETGIDCKGCDFAVMTDKGFGCKCPDDFPLKSCKDGEVIKLCQKT